VLGRECDCSEWWFDILPSETRARWAVQRRSSMLCRPEHIHIHRRVSRGKSITLSRKSTTINTLLKAGTHEVTVTCWPTAVKKLNKRRQAAVFSSVKGEGDFDVFRRAGATRFTDGAKFCLVVLVYFVTQKLYYIRYMYSMSAVGSFWAMSAATHLSAISIGSCFPALTVLLRFDC